MNTSRHVPRVLVFLLLLCGLSHVARGTGSLYDPPSRPVMWKYGYPTPKNYNYMQLNCGGEKQLEDGPKQCGVCGDYVNGTRDHEYGGTYGTGLIGRYYPAGIEEFQVKVELLAFEEGFFEFRLCPANNRPVTQACLDDYLLPIKEGFNTGTPFRFLPKAAGDYRLTIAVPPNITCDRCVLQWRYHTGNSWGTDPVTGKNGKGFGPQEEFYNCADIRIGGVIPDTVRANPFFSPLEPSPLVNTKQTDATKRRGVNPTSVDHMNANTIDILTEPANPGRSLLINDTISTNDNSVNTEWRIAAKGTADPGFVQSSATGGGNLDQTLDQTNMIPPLGSLPALSKTAGETSQQTSVPFSTTTDVGSLTIASNTEGQTRENTQRLSAQQLGTNVNVNTLIGTSAETSSGVMSNLMMTSAIDPTFKVDQKQMASIVINPGGDGSPSMVDQTFTMNQSGHQKSGQAGKLIINTDANQSGNMADHSSTMGQSGHQNSGQTGKLIINTDANQPTKMPDQSFTMGQSEHKQSGQTGKFVINTDISGSRGMIDHSSTMGQSEHQNSGQTGKLIISTEISGSRDMMDQSSTMGQSEHQNSGQTGKLIINTDANQPTKMADKSFTMGQSEHKESGQTGKLIINSDISGSRGMIDHSSTMGQSEHQNSGQTGKLIISTEISGSHDMMDQSSTMGQSEHQNSGQTGKLIINTDANQPGSIADHSFSMHKSEKQLSGTIGAMDLTNTFDAAASIDNLDTGAASGVDSRTNKKASIDLTVEQRVPTTSSDQGIVSPISSGGADQAFRSSNDLSTGMSTPLVSDIGREINSIDQAFVSSPSVDTRGKSDPMSGEDQLLSSSNNGMLPIQGSEFVSSNRAAATLQDQAFVSSNVGTSIQDQPFGSSNVGVSDLQDQVFVSSDVGAANVQDQAFVSSDLGTTNLQDQALITSDLGTANLQDQAFASSDVGATNVQDQAFVSSDLGTANLKDQAFVSPDVGAENLQDQAFVSMDLGNKGLQDQAFVSSGIGVANLQDQAFVSMDLGNKGIQDQTFVSSDLGAKGQDQAFVSSNLGTATLQDQAFVSSDVGGANLQDQAFVSSDVGAGNLQDQAFVSSDVGANLQDQAFVSSDVGAGNLQDQAFVSSDVGAANLQDQTFVSSDVGAGNLRDQAFVSSDVGAGNLQDQAFVSLDVGAGNLQDQAFVSTDVGAGNLQDQAFVSSDVGATNLQDQAFVSSDVGATNLQDQAFVSSDVGTIGLQDQAFVSSDVGATSLQDQAFVSSADQVASIQVMADRGSLTAGSGMTLNDNTLKTHDVAKDRSMTNEDVLNNRNNLPFNDMARMNIAADNTFNSNSVNQVKKASILIPPLRSNTQVPSSNNLGTQDSAFVNLEQQIGPVEMSNQQGISVVDDRTTVMLNTPSGNQMDAMMITGDIKAKSNTGSRDILTSISRDQTGTTSFDVGFDQNMQVPDTMSSINIRNEAKTVSIGAMPDQGNVGLNIKESGSMSNVDVENRVNTLSTGGQIDQSSGKLNIQTPDIMPNIDVGNSITDSQMEPGMGDLNIQTPDAMSNIDVGNSIGSSLTDSQMDPGMGELNMQAPDIMPNIDALNVIDTFSTGSQIDPGMGELNIQTPDTMLNIDVGNSIGITSNNSQMDQSMGELNMQVRNTVPNTDALNAIDTFSTVSQIDPGIGALNKQAPDIMPNIDVGNSLGSPSTDTQMDPGMGELNMQTPDMMPNIDVGIPTGSLIIGSQGDQNIGELNMQLSESVTSVDVGSKNTENIQASLDKPMNTVNTNVVGNVPSSGLNELPRDGSRDRPVTGEGASGIISASTSVRDTSFTSFDSFGLPDSTAIGVDSPPMNDQLGPDIALTNELNLVGKPSPTDRRIGGSFTQPTNRNEPTVQATNIDPFVETTASQKTSNVNMGQPEGAIQSGGNVASSTQRTGDRTIIDFNPPPGASITIDSSMTLDTSSDGSIGTVDVRKQIGDRKLPENNARVDVTFTNMDAPLATDTTGQERSISVMGGSVRTTLQGAMNTDTSMRSQGAWESNSLDFNQQPDFGNSVDTSLRKNIARTQSAATNGARQEIDGTATIDTTVRTRATIDKMNMAKDTRTGGDLNKVDGSALITGQTIAPRQTDADRKIVVSNTVIANEPNTNSMAFRVVDTTTDRTTFMNDVRATKERMNRKFQAKSMQDNRRDSTNDVPENIKNEINSFNINNIPDDSVMGTNVQVDASGVLRPRFGQRVDQTTRFRNLNRSFNTTNVGSSSTSSESSSSDSSSSSGGVMRVVIDPRTGAETRIWGSITGGNTRANGQRSLQGDTRNNGRTSTSSTGGSRIANGDRRGRGASITRGDRRQSDFMASRRQGQPGSLTNLDSRGLRVSQPARSRDTSSSERARMAPRTRFETPGGRRFVTNDRSARRGEFPDTRFPGDRRPIPTRPIDTGFGRDRRFDARVPARFGPITRTDGFLPPPRRPIGGAIGFDGLSPFRGTVGPRFPGAITFDGGRRTFAFGRGFPMLEGGGFPGASPILTSSFGSGPFDPFMGGTLTPTGFGGF